MSVRFSIATAEMFFHRAASGSMDSVRSPLVGRDRVLAGTDCGFGTFIGRDGVAESVAWKKFEELAAGAEIATKRLWS